MQLLMQAKVNVDQLEIIMESLQILTYHIKHLKKKKVYMSSWTKNMFSQ